MKLSFIKRIDTIKNSIFYSLIKFNNEIIAFGRRHYASERVIKKIALNDIIKSTNDIGTFELGNLTITVNSLEEQQNKYIIL
jgi:hypothetical protein